MRILKYIIGILVALVLVMAIGTGLFLRYQNGGDAIGRLVERATADSATKIRLAGLRGNLWHDFTIGALGIADKDGEWLTISDVHIVWQPGLVLRRRQGIDVVDIRHVALARRPATSDKPEKAAGAPPALDRVASLVPKKLAVETVDVAPAVGGVAQQLTLAGQGDLAGYQVEAHSLAGAALNLQGRFAYTASGGAAQLRLSEAPHGVIGALARLPAEAAIDGQVDVTSGGDAATLRNFALRVGDATVTAHGAMTPAQIVNARIEVVVPDLALLQAWVPKPLAGDLRASVALAGPLDRLAVDGQLDSDALAFGDHQLALLAARLPLTGDFSQVRDKRIDAGGRVTLSGIVDGKAFDVAADAHLQDDALDAAGLSAHYDVYGVTGNGHYNFGDTRFRAVLASDAVPVNKILPQSTLNGTASLSLTAEGDRQGASASGQALLQTTQGDSHIDFRADAAQGYADLQATLAGVLRYDAASFDLAAHVVGDAEKLTADRLRLAGPGLSIDGSGAWQKTARLADAEATVAVTDFSPIGAVLGLQLEGSLEADARLAADKGIQRADIALRKLRYRHGDLDITLAKPTAVHLLGDKANLTPTLLRLAGGTVTAQGRMAGDIIAARAEIRHIDLNRLSKTGMETAMLDGLVTLSGQAVAPVIVAHGAVAGRSGDMPLRLVADADWRQNRLQIKGDARMRSTSAQLAATLAGGLSLKPFVNGLAKASALDGSLAANVPLNEFNTLLWPRGHRVAGRFAGRARLRGNLGAPQMLGRFTLDHFDYDHPASGVCLRDAHAVIDGSTNVISLHDFTARDPRGGTFNAGVQLSLAAPRPVEGSLAFRDFRLFCGGLATGTLDGRIGAKGSLQAMAVDGRLILGPLTIQIPAGRNTTPIPEVETVRIVPGGALPEALKPQSVVRLDVTLEAPSRIYVRGRGLDAEFGGNLHVGGTASAPDIRGAFGSRRGRFTLLDRVMTLARANLRFEGPIPPSPFLDVAAATDVDGTTINVALTGPAAKPGFSLSSDPARPQDEVLALLLFGRELKTLSPFQACQLAQATRELAGLDGGGPDLLDRARGVLGVDTLDVGTDDDNNVTVSTGKYVTDKVYVGVQQGTTPESREVTTQVELTPSVTANTTLDADGNQGVGVGWKWDY